jgi:hypothetical protein
MLSTIATSREQPFDRHQPVRRMNGPEKPQRQNDLKEGEIGLVWHDGPDHA